ncbi:MAG: hypothetical protein P8M28_00105 [Alphaproteobacteria bacterium]|mgnify:CR=1 FL=1|jgi:hypothetical protein|nr:hypothetical protein [Alphaproteobacteria bacterium]
MRFVFAALMLVFLATSVHAQDDADDEEMLLLLCLMFDDCGFDEPSSTEPAQPTTSLSASGNVSLAICNESGETVSVAIANDTDDLFGEEFHARG